MKRQVEVSPINTKNRQEMIDLGYHPKDKVRHDWSKTEAEKSKLKRLRNQYPYGRGFDNQSWGAHTKTPIPVPGKLIVYVWGQPTKSYKCMQHDIPEILCKLKEGFTSKVTKYQWNGKTYQSNELPFWKPKVKGGRAISL